MIEPAPVLSEWERGSKWTRSSLQKYGLAREEYADLREKQDGKCAICQEPGRLGVDHNHEIGVVRGLLCNHCNSLLGFAKDSPARLFRAIGYLTRENRARAS